MQNCVLVGRHRMPSFALITYNIVLIWFDICVKNYMVEYYISHRTALYGMESLFDWRLARTWGHIDNITCQAR